MHNLKVFTIPEYDWEALYCDGKLVTEGHEICLSDIKECVPICKLEIIHISNFDSDEHYFPQTIEEFAQFNWEVE